MNTFNGFTGLYPLSKTLRFELKPIGKTLQFIINNGILEQDKHRADSYSQVKEIINEYHKAFIERGLTGFELKYNNEGKKNSLLEYFMYYNIKNREERDKNTYKQIQNNLRKQITDRLSKDEAFQRINKKELIQQDLISFVETQPNSAKKRALVEEFRNFTTYFSGFHENRKNMYSAEEKSTSIAYRLINENLPKFVDNIQVFSKVMGTEISKKMPQLYQEFQKFLNVENIEEMFHLKYFSSTLTQSQIDVYNAIIGGITSDDNVRIKGLNEYINLYNQQHKDTKLPKLKLLLKQILSERNPVSWLPEKFDSDEQMLTAIKQCYENLSERVFGNTSLRLQLELLGDFDLNGIFISNDPQLADISQKIFGNWGIIQKAIQTKIANCLPQKRKESFEDYQERITKRFKSFDSFSIGYIEECLSAVGIPSNKIEKYFSDLGVVNNRIEQKENHFVRIANAYEEIRDLLNNPYPMEKRLSQDKAHVEKIKQLLDAIKALQHFIKPLLSGGDEPNKDERFYGEFTALWNELDQITPLYNMVRNYITRKPYSEKKIKLNFENSTLMDGWDLNKEKDNTTIILRKDNLYYLGIMNKKFNKIFDKYPGSTSDEYYEKMEYKLLPGANKMLPKVFLLSKSGLDEFNPSQEIRDNYEKGTHKKGINFKLEDCHALIDFFKTSINKHSDWKKFDFKFSETSTYEDLSGFYKEVEQQGYKVSFRNVSANYIDTLIDEGKLYLFQIYNKDFSPYSKGIPNMHTLYWKMLFDEQNLENVVYKLNGQAEIFYRESSLEYHHPTHPANQPVMNKNQSNVKQESVFPYDLIKNRRYTIDKFQFHVPITMNFKSNGVNNINQQVNECLQHADDTHIIGIDRGERHLLYLVVIDKKGNIKEQCSLNEIMNEYNGNRYSTDYHNLLNRREDERLKARQSWQSIESIKDLKEGYLSQVIHKISELIVKYNAIVVLEDLNLGFIRGRQKIEKQIYQKFEKMLIDKLNYLVDKKKEPNELGGILKAYQLANKFESFQKMGKQSGFLFYIPAWNTSKIDPQTGFVNLLDVHYESTEKAKSFFCKFDSIKYNTSKDWFEFELDYSKFNQKAEGTRIHWTLCSYGTRIETLRYVSKNSQWDSVEVNLTEKFKEHFNKYHIDIHTNLKEAISRQIEKNFFEGLLHLLKLTLQMRNSKIGADIDYLISPVADDNGIFYDSRSCDPSLPANADANGAYNIARKGLWILKQIKETVDLKKLKLTISNKEWLRFAQEKPYLND
ncbi:type V CRISPR-associated protein Cas12a/Cpf1 [Bacteroides uniformis]|uniref:type V CRISPR-associated protein Cas12a/Cpf1 n=1 Tax=Bacteroides uniformis TaxID=820 RepID=UPI00232DB42E|nr:type V CRISPR-associated protein Cas12a/Cpf1 [Bacteroides uniformis]MDC1819440.1 type V CRISPR-associated protein Cas12a/Cpf1 [Bacteroides uniformis]